MGDYGVSRSGLYYISPGNRAYINKLTITPSLNAAGARYLIKCRYYRDATSSALGNYYNLFTTMADGTGQSVSLDYSAIGELDGGTVLEFIIDRINSTHNEVVDCTIGFSIRDTT